MPSTLGPGREHSVCTTTKCPSQPANRSTSSLPAFTALTALQHQTSLASLLFSAVVHISRTPVAYKRAAHLVILRRLFAIAIADPVAIALSSTVTMAPLPAPGRLASIRPWAIMTPCQPGFLLMRSRCGASFVHCPPRRTKLCTAS